MKSDKKSYARLGAVIGALLLAGLGCAPAFAQQLPPRPSPGDGGLGAEWVAMSPFQLHTMRGGFDLPSGMRLSFGIERVVQVNGELLTHTRFHIADLSQLTPQQAAALGDATRPLLVQVGTGNTFDPAAMSGGVNGLVVQNTLNNQDIRALTNISVSVDTLEMFKQLNANEALQNAIQGGR